MGKVCSKCKIEKPLEGFSRDKSREDGLHHWCKNCVKTYHAEYYIQNKVIMDNKNKTYYIGNKTSMNQKNKEYREANKKQEKGRKKIWHEENSDHVKEYYKNLRRADVNFKITCNLRSRMAHAIRNDSEKGSAVRDLGCSIEYLKLLFFTMFQPGMTWENYGQVWEIDHIIPLDHFDLTDRDQFLTACNYKNLQPLWVSDNRNKGARVVENAGF